MTYKQRRRLAKIFKQQGHDAAAERATIYDIQNSHDKKSTTQANN